MRSQTEFGNEGRRPTTTRPSTTPCAIAEEEPQRADRLVERAAIVAVVLLEVVEAGQHLLRPQQRGAGHPAEPGQAGDPAHLLLPGALAQGFELDETGAHGYGIGNWSHRLPPSPRIHPASAPMSPTARLLRYPRAAASYNHALTAPRVTLAAARHPATFAHPAPAAFPQPARRTPPVADLVLVSRFSRSHLKGMKAFIRTFSIPTVFVYLALTSAQAQETVLHHFAGGSDGRSAGSLTRADSTLYGMSPYGGSSDRGTIFRMNTDGSGYSLLHEFLGGDTDGQYPSGSLTLSGSTLFGMAFGGGTGSYGTVFSMNTDGNGYELLHHFAGGSGDGASSRSSLTLSGSTLYGMTSSGGTGGFGDGTIFRLNTDGTGFTLLHSFNAGNGDGSDPFGSLTLAGSKLYGMARLGISQGAKTPTGTIFSMNIDGSGFSLLHTFTGGASDGAEPWGSLTLVGSRLYGMTNVGGPDDKGTIFAIDTDGTDFSLLHSFTNTTDDGGNPFGSLTLSGSMFYGMTQQNGASANGTLFSINTDGSDFALLHSFSGPPSDGAAPRGDLVVSSDGTMFFGTTPTGGQSNGGVVFSFAVPEPSISVLLILGALLAASYRRRQSVITFR